MSTFYNRRHYPLNKVETKAEERARRREAARQDAWYYHTTLGMSYEDACNRAGYDPTEHGRFTLIVFAGMAAVWGVTAFLLRVLA